MANEPVLSYQSREPTSWGALVVFWLSVGSVFLFFLLFPPAVMLVVALIMMGRLAQTMDTRGQRYASAAAMVSGGGVVLWLAAMVLMPSMGGHHVISNRSVCAANLRGIAQMLNVYAGDNHDAYPCVAFAPYSAGLNEARAAPGSRRAEDVLSEYYQAPHRQAGSPQAILWQLVLRGDVSPKGFLCPSDPLLKGKARGTAGVAAQVTDGKLAYFDNFQAGSQLSYSVSYPWKADGTVGKWWRGDLDASLPMMADVNPEHGTGTPVRDMVPVARPATNATWNSAAHEGDGQNVAFGDNHVEFTRTPDCGQSNDNIYAWSGIPGPAQYGGIPAGKTMPLLTADKAPFDVVMVPVRNATTGGY